MVIEIYIGNSHVTHFIQWLCDIYFDQNYECWVASFDKNCDIKIDAIIVCMTMNVVLRLLPLLEVHKTAHKTEYNGFLNKYMYCTENTLYKQTSSKYSIFLHFSLYPIWAIISRSGCYIPFGWLVPTCIR